MHNLFGGVGRRLGCGHVFHLKCLLGWIKVWNGEKWACPLRGSDLMGDTGGVGDRGTTNAVYAPTSVGYISADDIGLIDGHFFQW